MLLAGHDLRKSFGGVEAVRGVSIEAHPGSVLALLGENGAGNRLSCGFWPGTVSRCRHNYHRRASVYQLNSKNGEARRHPARFTGACLRSRSHRGREYRARDWPSRRGFVSWRGVQQRAREALARLGSEITPDRRLRDLTLAERQVIEIARAIDGECHYLILDEPTAALSSAECDRLFDVVGRLLKLGIAAIYITHRLDEVHRVADQGAGTSRWPDGTAWRRQRTPLAGSR